MFIQHDGENIFWSHMSNVALVPYASNILALPTAWEVAITLDPSGQRSGGAPCHCQSMGSGPELSLEVGLFGNFAAFL